VRTIEVVGVLNNQTRINGFRSKDYDAVLAAAEDLPQFRDLTRSGAARLGKTSIRLYGLLLNSSDPALRDVRVRRAIYLAVDRKAIADAVFQGQGYAADQPILKRFPGYLKSLEGKQQSLAEARRLLGGRQVRFTCIQSQASVLASMTLIVQQQLKRVGIDVDLRPIPGTAANQAFIDKQYPCMALGMTHNEASAGVFQTTYQTTMNPGGLSAAQNRLLRTALSQPADTKASTRAWEAVDRSFVTSPIHIPLVAGPTYALVRPGIELKNQAMSVAANYDVRFLSVAR
jgi:ABC-type transport system substrate-binding protein